MKKKLSLEAEQEALHCFISGVKSFSLEEAASEIQADTSQFLCCDTLKVKTHYLLLIKM